jgi:hypothetical protein
MGTSELERLQSHARGIAQELLPMSELLALSARALEGLLAELCVAEVSGASGSQAALVRTAALDMAVTAMHIVAGAEKMLLLAKLAGLREPAQRPD